jgi:hypothetical protein
MTHFLLFLPQKFATAAAAVVNVHPQNTIRNRKMTFPGFCWDFAKFFGALLPTVFVPAVLK